LTAQDRIRRLEALLARVAERAALPRPPPGEQAPALEMAPEHVEATAPVMSGGGLDVETAEMLDESALVSDRPPPVEPMEEADSRERLVVAQPVTRDELREDVTEVNAPVTPQSPPEQTMAPDIEVVETTRPPPVEPVEEEEPPASSRRPIVAEPPLEELTFGEAAPPPAPHTPPPESGRQVAAPPVDLDFDGDLTGVRARHEDAPIVILEPRGPLVPHVTRAQPVAGEAAEFAGQARAFEPLTFGELLDATLSI
jgi:hypothetical protein